MLRANIPLVSFDGIVGNQPEGGNGIVTEPSYHPRERGESPKQGESMDVCTGLLVITWFITIYFGIQISWASLSFNIDVLAQFSPYLIAAIAITIFWIYRKFKIYKSRS